MALKKHVVSFKYNSDGEPIAVTEDVDMSPEEEAEFLGTPLTIQVDPPKEVTPAQGRLALLNAGLLDTVETLINGSNDRSIKIWYEYATTWHRHNPNLVALATALNLSDADVDALFLAGSQIGVG